jgi:hypothetical protein
VPLEKSLLKRYSSAAMILDPPRLQRDRALVRFAMAGWVPHRQLWRPQQVQPQPAYRP